ncbi:MAG TPA: response regulator [Candidatus Eisenbacteria bacterium]
MSRVGERDLEREIARSLVDALQAALAPGGGQPELRAARDAAQLLEMPGLDRLISALAPHAPVRPWPTEIQPVVERLQRVGARAAASGDLDVLRSTDPDFLALAGEIVAMEWSALPSRPGGPGPSVPTLIAAEMLSDLPLSGEESASVARRIRLTMPVAAAVRAAIDWISGRHGPKVPLALRGDASVLEIGCELRDAAGLAPAHEVLAGVDGSLGPALGPPVAASARPWVLRVPSFGARATYAMLEQGGLKLAVPWHAVIKLQVVRRDAIQVRSARLGMEVLSPLAPLTRRATECPVAIVAHGLKRAWMVADRLVWRLAADPSEPDARMKEAGLTSAVATDDGEVFGLAEPRALLAGVPLPPPPVILDTPDEATRTSAPEPAPQERPAAPVAAAERSRSAAEPRGREVTPVPMPALDESWVTPLATLEESEAPAPEPVLEEIAPAAEPPAAPERAARRALVAEDSITARIFLTRLLEQHGFEVVAVERGSDLHAALAGGPWSLVCADVDLPDARGAAFLRDVRDRLPEETPLVALARDEQDIAAARVAGVRRTLLKPVEPGALRRMLDRLGLAETASE